MLVNDWWAGVLALIVAMLIMSACRGDEAVEAPLPAAGIDRPLIDLGPVQALTSDAPWMVDVHTVDGVYALGPSLEDERLAVVSGAVFRPGEQPGVALWGEGTATLLVDLTDPPHVREIGPATGHQDLAFSSDGSVAWSVDSAKRALLRIRRIEISTSSAVRETEVEIAEGRRGPTRILRAAPDELLVAIDDQSLSDVANESLLHVSADLTISRVLPTDPDGTTWVAATDLHQVFFTGLGDRLHIVDRDSGRERVVEPPPDWKWSPVSSVPTPSLSPALAVVAHLGGRDTLLVGLNQAGEFGQLARLLAEVNMNTGETTILYRGERRIRAAFYTKDANPVIVRNAEDQGIEFIDIDGTVLLEISSAIYTAQ